MKKYLYYLLLFISTLNRASAGEIKTKVWGVLTNGVQMAIEVKDNPLVITNNQPVKLLITYRNVSSNANMTVYKANYTEEDPSCFFVVISPSGRDISPENVGVANSGSAEALGPQKEIQIEFNLSAICSFNEVGAYKIVARKGIYWREEKHGFLVFSNPLNVVIVADK